MARRRKNQSPVEPLMGIVGLIIFMSVFNPVFRNKVSAAVAMFFTILTIAAIVGLVIYLIIIIKKLKDKPVEEFAPNYSRNNNSSKRDDGKFDIGFSGTSKSSSEPVKPSREWNLETIQAIEWRRFEIVVREFLRLNGFEATDTSTGADGGVDIRVHRKDNPESKGIVQCKAWNTYKVGIKIVRELFGVMAAERANMGMVITSGIFTNEAVEFAECKMKLVDGKTFIEHIRKLPGDQQQHLLDIALEGDYTTPTCPKCDMKMTIRESSKSGNSGNQFWGCFNYPRCRQTFAYKA